MREFMRKRYGCDHCKKVGGSKYHMARHEAGCTNNPNRICSLHKFVTDGNPAPSVSELIEALKTGGYKKLVEVSDNCPVCKLAALRQSFVMPEPGEPWPDEPQDGRERFNFKEELSSLWADVNLANEGAHP